MALYKDSEYCSGDGSNLGMPAQRRVRFSKATGEAITSHLQCRLRTAIVTDQRRHKQGQKIGSSVRTNKEESMPVCH